MCGCVLRYKYINTYVYSVCIYTYRPDFPDPPYPTHFSYSLPFTSPKVKTFSHAHQNILNYNLLKRSGWKESCCWEDGTNGCLQASRDPSSNHLVVISSPKEFMFTPTLLGPPSAPLPNNYLSGFEPLTDVAGINKYFRLCAQR